MLAIDRILDYLKEHDVKVFVQGDTPRIISKPCSLKHPVKDGLTFYKPKRWDADAPEFGPIACLLTTAEAAANLKADLAEITVILVENPRLTFIMIVSRFFVKTLESGIHPSAFVHGDASIDATAQIGAFVSIGAGASIGRNTLVSPNATIGENVRIGDDCFIGPGAALGQPGFGYERDAQGVLVLFPHIGGVDIGNDVHIGANTTIDRGTIDDTIIEDRARIDNLCHISHNVRIGSDTAVIANSMIGGSVSIGPGSWVAPSASVVNGITIGKSTTIGMGAVVVKPVGDDQVVAGVPARNLEDFKTLQKALTRLLKQPD